MRSLLLVLLALVAFPASATYTKIANNGAELPDSASQGSNAGDWACTRDNASGLIWEVKTPAGGVRDLNQTYTHYDDATQAQKSAGSHPTQAEIDAASNSTGWVNAVNVSALCGHRDWKMPSLIELEALVDTATVPSINPTFFPNTPASDFWSASPDLEQPHNAWNVSFSYGYSYSYYRGDGYHLRLVRGGAAVGNFALSLAASGTGYGRLTGSPGGIDCASSAGTASGTCSASLASGSTVTLSATPATGSTFSGWSGACAGTSTSCSVTMAAAKSVTAGFNLAPLSPQSISFGAAPTGVTFAGSGVVSATATSGLAVIFSSNTPAICTLVDHTLSGVSVGTCTVAANQPGNSTYSAAPQVTQDIAVGKASQTVSFDTLPTLVFGGSGVVSASTTSGLAAVLSSSTPAVCALSGNTLSAVGVGACTVVADQPGNANYHAAPQVTRDIAVGKASQSISFGPLTDKTYGTTPFSVLATAVAAGSVAFASQSGGVCTLVDHANGSATVSLVGTGACTIRASHPGDSHYNAAANNDQIFTVNAISVSLVLGNLGPHTYNGSARVVTCTPMPSGVAVSVTYNGSGTAPSAVGSYPVSCVTHQTGYSGSTSGILTISAPPDPPSWQIATGVNPVGSGTASCTPNPVIDGGSASCSANPAPGYLFTAWSGACSGATCVLTNITGPLSVLASFTANLASSSSTLSANPSSPAPAGQTTTLSVQVSGAAGTPTGNVVFKDASSTLGTVALNGSGSASYSGNFAIGTHSLSASYAGNATYQPSVAYLSYQVASRIDSTISVKTAPNPSQPGQSVQVSVSVTPQSNVGSLSGTVQVSGDGQSCSITLPEVSCSLVFASKGAKRLTAAYSGNSSYSAGTGSGTHFVGQRPSLTPILLLLLD